MNCICPLRIVSRNVKGDGAGSPFDGNELLVHVKINFICPTICTPDDGDGPARIDPAVVGSDLIASALANGICYASCDSRIGRC